MSSINEPVTTINSIVVPAIKVAISSLSLQNSISQKDATRNIITLLAKQLRKEGIPMMSEGELLYLKGLALKTTDISVRKEEYGELFQIMEDFINEKTGS